jgi:FAD/FMN-containing dehydrogenase
MKDFDIHEEQQAITIEPGICFHTLIDYLDAHTDLELPCYPTSSLTSTVGGWFGVGGEEGIGAFQNGSLLDNILEIEYIDGNGEIHILQNTEEISILFGTCGIFGIITRLKMKLVPRRKKTPYYFGFNSLSSLVDALDTLKKVRNVYMLKFSDHQFAKRVNIPPSHSYFLFFITQQKEKKYSENSESSENLKNSENSESRKIITIMEKKGGTYLGDELSEKHWEDIFLTEMRVKKEVPILMLQSIKTSLYDLAKVISLFEKLAEERKLNHCFYGIMNRCGFLRLLLFTPTDNDYIVHFLSSKGLLHRVVKRVYQKGWGSVYSYGMLNSIYLHKFEPHKLKKYRKIKKKNDPKMILNPLKMISTKTSYSRINTIFELNLLWRKFAVKLGIENTILSLNNREHNKKERGLNK